MKVAWGELRRSRTHAVFVSPPPPDKVPKLPGDLEYLTHEPPKPMLPPLVRLAPVHTPFETIQPRQPSRQ